MNTTIAAAYLIAFFLFATSDYIKRKSSQYSFLPEIVTDKARTVFLVVTIGIGIILASSIILAIE